jgi:hypothetical protein
MRGEKKHSIQNTQKKKSMKDTFEESRERSDVVSSANRCNTAAVKEWDAHGAVHFLSDYAKGLQQPQITDLLALISTIKLDGVSFFFFLSFFLC